MRQNKKLLIALSLVAVMLIAVVMVVLLLLAKNTSSSDSQTNNASSSSSAITKSIVSSSKDNWVTKQGKIELVSSNTQVVSNQEWDFTFSLPSDIVITSEIKPEYKDANRLLLNSSELEIQIDPSIMDMNMDYHQAGRLLSLGVIPISQYEVSRVRTSIPALKPYLYVTNYKEGDACHPGSGIDPYSTNYCSDGGILDKHIYVYCYPTDEASLALCDKIIEKIEVTHKIIN